MLTQHLEHIQQQMLNSCSAHVQGIRYSKLHRPVPRSHSPSAHPLLSFPLLSPSQTILVSLLLLFCHCFLGDKNKSTSYFSHAVTAIIYSHTVTGQICRKTIPIARQRSISLHFMCWVKISIKVLIFLSWGNDLNALWVRHRNHNSYSAKGLFASKASTKSHYKSFQKTPNGFSYSRSFHWQNHVKLQFKHFIKSSKVKKKNPE